MENSLSKLERFFRNHRYIVTLFTIILSVRRNDYTIMKKTYQWKLKLKRNVKLYQERKIWQISWKKTRVILLNPLDTISVVGDRQKSCMYLDIFRTLNVQLQR